MAQSSKDTLISELNSDVDSEKVLYRSNSDLKKEKSLLKLYLMLLWKKVDDVEPAQYNHFLADISSRLEDFSIPESSEKYRNYILIDSNEKQWEKRSPMLKYSSGEPVKGKRVNKNMFASGLQGVWGVPGK